MMDLAIYDLKQHKGRFIATVLGVGLLFTIVLAMNGLYRGVLYEGLSLIRATDPDLWLLKDIAADPSTNSPQYPSSIITASGRCLAWKRPALLSFTR